ncbi:hypothetical protein BZA70DRAFT_272627 [Myxozyma melibiosi]|uniref:Zn(2)-C6 fungal-type domain-containing protein n=1 Tax=Myxozyma melibiosi TaxID=54550 RepID=A0ABR1FFM3_9ASCO
MTISASSPAVDPASVASPKPSSNPTSTTTTTSSAPPSSIPLHSHQPDSSSTPSNSHHLPLSVSTTDSVAHPRKRSKVSRACDECRRKKIRCDATLDGGPEQCSSCRRVGEKCSFSRIPMKRGPSKGYIKELEDRLNSLENSFGVDGSPATRRSSAVSVDVRAYPTDSSAASSANPSNGHKNSISSTGSNTYPADSPNSQYSGSFTYAYGSPSTVIGDQSARPRTDSAHSLHSLPPPAAAAANPPHQQQVLLNSPTLSLSLPGQRKRAFSSTMEYSNDRARQQQPSPMAPIRQQSLSSGMGSAAAGTGGLLPERLPSIDSLRSSTNTNQLPPLQSSTHAESVYMAPPNGSTHLWKPSYGGSRLPAHRPADDENSPRTPQPPNGFSRHNQQLLQQQQQQPFAAPAPAPAPQQLQPFPRQLHRHSIGTGMMGSYDPVMSSSAGHTPTDSLSRRGSVDSGFTFSWDDDVIDAYYSHIHPILPILAQSRSKLRSRLVASTVPARNACLSALYALVRGMIFRKRSDDDLQTAVKWVNEAITSPGRLSFVSSLLIVQTMILLALETVNHGPAALGDHMRSSSYWLGTAVGMAYSLRLNSLSTSTPGGVDDSDLDSDARSGRRTFVVLYILDRWTSVSLSQPMMISDDALVLRSEDLLSLTPVSYHLVRFSTALGHVIGACSHFEEDAVPDARHHHIATLLRGELERVRESVDDLWESKPILEVTYWHIRLLTLRLLQNPDPQVLLGPAVRIVRCIVPQLLGRHQQNGSGGASSTGAAAAADSKSQQQSMAPFGHHFLALATETLLDLTDISETCDEAWRSLNSLLDSLIPSPTSAPPTSAENTDGGGDHHYNETWEACVRMAIENKKSRTARNSISGASVGPATIANKPASASQPQSGGGAGSSSAGGPPGLSSGLERLASIAVGESTSSGSRNLLAVETSRLRSVGYLWVLAL